MTKKKKQKINKTIKLAVLAVLVFLLLKKVNWLDVWNNFKDVKIGYIVLYVILYLGGVLISARKWQVLAQFKNFSKSYFFYLKTYLLGTFLNNFFPSFVGGDAYRIHSLGRKKKRFKESSVTVVVDRISGLAGVIILSAFFGLLNYKILYNLPFIFWLILVMVVISSISLLGVFFFNAKIVQNILGYLPKKIKLYIKQLGEFREKRMFFKTMNYSFLFIMVGIALANYMLFLALGIKLSLFNFLSVTFLANIIASIPVSIGNVGIKEWAYILLFGVFGVSASAAVTIVLIARVLQMLVSLIAIPFYLSNKKELQK